MQKTLLFAAGLFLASLCVLPALAQPPAVTISGPTAVSIPCGCGNVQWTANASGGTPPYVLYAWTINGASKGTNSSTLTETYCNNTSHAVHKTENVAVTVTDSNGREASDTHVTEIELEGCGG